ncbi:hypothetical protein OTU49_010694, partial [Cherax quadricarinatus]
KEPPLPKPRNHQYFPLPHQETSTTASRTKEPPVPPLPTPRNQRLPHQDVQKTYRQLGGKRGGESGRVRECQATRVARLWYRCVKTSTTNTWQALKVLLWIFRRCSVECVESIDWRCSDNTWRTESSTSEAE